MNPLPEAAARREVRRQISELLERLQPHDRRVVLEDLLDEIYSAPRDTLLPVAKVFFETRIQPAAQDEERSLADTIKSWCLRQPTGSEYGVRDAAVALLPHDKNGMSKIYSSILRSSPQSDRTPPKHPRFIWLGNGKFKLYKSETA